MFKWIVFLCLFAFTAPREAVIYASGATCSCPDVYNLQKTGQTGNSITFSWDNSSYGTQLYRVWYVRMEDGYNSGYSYTGGSSYQFSGLPAGHYIFYFQAVCEGETGNFIGIEDTISA